MVIIESTSNKRIATTALCPASAPSRPDGMAGELYIPMRGNTGAGDNQPCSNLFGLDRSCLHFNSGWQPMDLLEGTDVHNR